MKKIIIHLLLALPVLSIGQTTNTAPKSLTSTTTVNVNQGTSNSATVLVNSYHYSLADFTSDVSNGTTVETDIFTNTTAANTLNNTGDKLIGDFNLQLTDNTSTATIRTYFGGTKVFDSGAITVTTTGYATVRMVVIRTGTTTARAYTQLITGSNAIEGYTQETDITGLTFTNTNIIKITAQAGGGGGGSGDIVGKMGTITFARAAQ